MIRAETQTDLIRVDDGQNGNSASITVSKTGDTATITAVSGDGTTTTTTVSDGTDGNDGVSPTAAVTQTSSGATITITDSSGTTTATVSDGANGSDGTSAYEAAVEAGYTGTEEQFNSDLVEVPNKASQNDVAGIISRGVSSTNNLLNNTDISERWFTSIPTVAEPITTFDDWAVYNITEDNDSFEESGDLWTIEINNIEEEYWGFLGAYQGSDVGEYDREVRYGNSYLYQDAELEENTTYTFSIYAFIDDYVISPLVQCVAIDEDGEEIPNTGWDSKDFTWSYISFPEDDRVRRLYKTFSSGSNTLWRIKFYGKAEWNESHQFWDWYEYYYGMNKIQLNEGDSVDPYEQGYWSLLTLQSSIRQTQREQDKMGAAMNYDENEIRRINNIIRGKKKDTNILAYSNWTSNTIFLPAYPAQYKSRDQWTRTSGIAKESWGKYIASSYYYEDSRRGSYSVVDQYRFYEYLLPYYSYNSSGETHSTGDYVLLNGGIYQDVSLSPNTNYTFAMTLYYPSDTSEPTGGFVDCKAITGSSPNYTTVPNTGFDIQEWEHFSGTKTWNVNNNGLGSSRAKLVRINFNTGNYTEYRFRIYGAIYWTSSSTTKYYGGHINYFSLKKNYYYPTGNIPSGEWYSDNWEYGPEYGIQNIYTKLDNQGETALTVSSMQTNVNKITSAVDVDTDDITVVQKIVTIPIDETVYAAGSTQVTIDLTDIYGQSFDIVTTVIDNTTTAFVQRDTSTFTYGTNSTETYSINSSGNDDYSVLYTANQNKITLTNLRNNYDITIDTVSYDKLSHYPKVTISGNTTFNGPVKRNDEMSSSEIDDFLDDLNIGGASSREVTQLDWVIESGTDGTWTWRKWQSGACDLWGVKVVPNDAPYSSGINGFWYGHSADITFPFPIKNVSGSYNALAAAAWAIAGASFPYSHSDSPDFITTSKIYCLSSVGGNINVTYKMVLHGRWK